MELSEIIKQRINLEGPISFRDFMEMALYYPGLGYYTSKQNIIGCYGDFYTSSNLSEVFGAMIAKQLEETWCLTSKKEFTIVEFGAGTGALCHDILDYLKLNPVFYDKLHYVIIEKSPVMREKEKTHLNEKVSWYDSIHDLNSITGCILSNELVDNFPVHKVVMQNELMEVFVDYRNGFTELLKPADKILKDYLHELNVILPKGFHTEINCDAIDWIKTIASSLKKGYVMTIDYGNTTEAMYKLCRSYGTLLCYHQHQITDQPYQNIGKQDITSHVNFSSLCHWGLKNGLALCGLTSQAEFLLALGFKDYLRKPAVNTGNIAQLAMKEIMLTRKLLMDMGTRFKVLIQQKGIEQKELLQGLKVS